MKEAARHWADVWAERIIREKGDKQIYVCASGITPSGTVHIGNFREIITVDLCVRALRDRSRDVRFIYSWDDYDVFRKIPANMPEKELLEDYLRKPITMTPDPFGELQSYARRNEQEMESLLPLVGIQPEYVYQAEAYRNCVYAEEIRSALAKRHSIRDILNEHRDKPLREDWWPVSIFCNSCLKDTTRVEDWDGAYRIKYVCDSCGNNEEIDLRVPPGCTKLFWRVDWPMRWAREKVDFEPAGKDHHSEGGSFDTAKRIVEEVYACLAPVSFQYDFIGIKGRGGKISSSEGEVVSLRDVLEIYQPEVVRYLFTSTRPNTEFSISFDLDVIKIYEDYDRCERIYFGTEKVSEKRAAKESRIYELSQIAAIPESPPQQIGFRHLCNILQINEGRMEGVMENLGVIGPAAERIEARAHCAWNWIQKYAPESFCFHLRPPDSDPVPISWDDRQILKKLQTLVEEELEGLNEKDLSKQIYSLAEECGFAPRDVFKLMYRILIGKEMGPRLASFMLTIGRERVLRQLAPYTR